MERKQKTAYLVLAIIIIAIIVGGVYFFAINEEETGVDYSIRSVTIDRPNFVVISDNLASVEVWAIPTGTSVNEDDHVKLGDGSLRSPRGENPQQWVVPIPETPSALTEIYARGYDSKGNEVARRSVDVLGATDIYESVWGDIIEEEVTLSPGQSATYETLSITFNRITEDSRCPSDVTCVTAGKAVASLTLSSGSLSETVSVSSDSIEPVSFGEYFIGLTEVRPELRSTTSIDPSEYEIVLSVSRNVKL